MQATFGRNGRLPMMMPPHLRLGRTQSSSPPLVLNFEIIIIGAPRRILLETRVVALGNRVSPMGPDHGIQSTSNEKR